MTVPDDGREWRKSTFSAPNGDCVEVDGNLRAVRDTKDRGVVLRVDMRAFVAAVRSGRLT